LARRYPLWSGLSVQGLRVVRLRVQLARVLPEQRVPDLPERLGLGPLEH
jgi:hypothetical protein